MADPIKVAKARQEIRAAQVRLMGIEKVVDFAGRVTMATEDKRAVLDVLKTLHDEAELAYEDAVRRESELLRRPAISDDRKETA